MLLQGEDCTVHTLYILHRVRGPGRGELGPSGGNAIAGEGEREVAVSKCGK